MFIWTNRCSIREGTSEAGLNRTFKNKLENSVLSEIPDLQLPLRTLSRKRTKSQVGKLKPVKIQKGFIQCAK